MTPIVIKLLSDIRNAGRAILDFTRGFTLDQYRLNLLIRSGCERQFEIMGEAAKRLRDEDRASFDLLPDLVGVLGFRNFLAHVYDQINDRRVWTIIETDLPRLLKQIDAILDP